MKVIVQYEYDSFSEAVQVHSQPLPAKIIDVSAQIDKEPAPTPKVKGRRGRPPGSKKAGAARPTAPAAEARSETTTAATPASEPSAPAASLPQPGANGLTIEDARRALQELNAKKGMAVCQKLMADLKMPRVSTLTPAEIPTFIEAVQKAIAS